MSDVAASPMDRKRWRKLPVTMPPRELTGLDVLACSRVFGRPPLR